MRVRLQLWLRAAALAATCGSVGCVSVPVGPLGENCSVGGHPGTGDSRSAWETRPRARDQATADCKRDSLTIGFFPTVGEFHQNGRATNGRELTVPWRIADYTLRPLAISAINVVSLGLPTATALVLEVYEDYSMKAGPCSRSIIGYCKGVRWLPEQNRGRPDERRYPDGGT